MNVWMRDRSAPVERFTRALDVFGPAPSERGDNGTANGGGHLLHPFGIVQRRDRETRPR